MSKNKDEEGERRTPIIQEHMELEQKDHLHRLKRSEGFCFKFLQSQIAGVQYTNSTPVPLILGQSVNKQPSGQTLAQRNQIPVQDEAKSQ